MSPADKPAVGFLGLGAMGFGMATHLVRQGYSVKGYDVFPATLERFQAAGGAVASSLADSARGNMYYICMVASASQVQSALFDEKEAVVSGKIGYIYTGGFLFAGLGLLMARTVLPKNATLILCSTVPAVYAQTVRDRLLALGREDIYFVDAPVSGGARRAADGTLSIMAGAPDAALERSKFLLAEMSDAEKLYLVPGSVGAGSNMKMVHQVLAAVQILAASEAMGFAARLGLDAATVRDAIVASDAWSWMYENRAPRMLAEDYFPGVSALTIILKDVVRLVSPSPFFTAYIYLVYIYKVIVAKHRIGHHHGFVPPQPVPHPAVRNRRTGLLIRTRARLRAQRRRRYGPHVLPRPDRPNLYYSERHLFLLVPLIK